MTAFEFPCPVARLHEWVPHRPPMVWIDEVLWATAEAGECRVRIDPHAHYMDGPVLRQSSLVEWMAQAYAYVRASQSLSGALPMAPQPKRAYLVSIQAVEFLSAEPGSEVRVKVEGAREIGQITMFGATVSAVDGRTLSRARLKVFAE